MLQKFKNHTFNVLLGFGIFFNIAQFLIFFDLHNALSILVLLAGLLIYPLIFLTSALPICYILIKLYSK